MRLLSLLMMMMIVIFPSFRLCLAFMHVTAENEYNNQFQLYWYILENKNSSHSKKRIRQRESQGF